ncbi:MAG: Tn3 family transposase [Cyanobacteria bacterium J06634_6]
MKRQWETEELIEQFTLMPSELALLPDEITNATAHNRLGFAVLLKFFQVEGRFPQHVGEVPKAVAAFITQQLNLSEEDYRQYQWSGRTIKRHRSQIRAFLGFVPMTQSDQQQLKRWLIDEILPLGLSFEALKAQASGQLRKLKIEPPAAKELERLIRSAARLHERSFCKQIAAQLSAKTRTRINALLNTESPLEDENSQFRQSQLSYLKTDPGRLGLKSLLKEIEKLQHIRELELPSALFNHVASKLVQQYRRRASTEPPRELRRHPPAIRYTLVAAFCWQREREIMDDLVTLLIQIIHRLSISAERRVERELIASFKRVNRKEALLLKIATESLKQPDGAVKDVVYPVAGPETLQALVDEQTAGETYQEKVHTRIRASYLHHYRRMVPSILDALSFHSNNEQHQPVIRALSILKRYQDSARRFYDSDEDLVIEGVLPANWPELVGETDSDGEIRINRVNYEICVLQALREKLRCRAVWVAGAGRYGNPEQDLPQDFEAHRDVYYQELSQPLEAEAFIQQLKQTMQIELGKLEQGMPKNKGVRIQTRKNGWISVSPVEAQPDPPNLLKLKAEIARRWPLTGLLEMLKETDLRVNFTEQFESAATRENLDRNTLQRRLLLCLYGLGTNTGLKRVCAGVDGENYHNLLYVKRHYIHKEHLRNAIAKVVNAVLRSRMEPVWGKGTSACASDSKKFGAWDQNLMTEWHQRYGGRGVMIYWHVEKKSVCIYSQLKTCSSSEVASMLEGLLRHNTEMKVERNYVDTHGQSEIAFAFCHLLGFNLMPRLKRIGAQRLYFPEAGTTATYENLQPVLSRAIDWDLIRQQYDQLIKYATALRLGTAETEVILRRFNRTETQHPTYQALAELGRAVKTIFLCRYLHSVELRQEIQDGLNVVERWNGANDFIFYGRSGEFASNRRDHQELAALALHLLQISLVYINTLMIQRVLSEPEWWALMQTEDLRALTPLLWSHVTPYGVFRLDFSDRIDLDPVGSVLLSA